MVRDPLMAPMITKIYGWTTRKYVECHGEIFRKCRPARTHCVADKYGEKLVVCGQRNNHGGWRNPDEEELCFLPPADRVLCKKCLRILMDDLVEDFTPNFSR